MKFRCETCKSKYSIADEKVRNKIIKITCPKCGNRILLRDRTNDLPGRSTTGALTDHGAVKSSGDVSAAAALPKRSTKPAPAPSKRDATAPLTDELAPHSLENRSRSALHRLLAITDERAEWFLRNDGTNDGPLSLTELRGRLQLLTSGEALVWNPRFGNEWRKPELVDELRELFGRSGSAPIPRRATDSAPHLRVIEGGLGQANREPASVAKEITKEPLRPASGAIPLRADAGTTSPEAIKETLREEPLSAAVSKLKQRSAELPSRAQRPNGLHSLAASVSEPALATGEAPRPQINPARLREGSIVSKLSRISAAPKPDAEPQSDTPPRPIEELPKPVPYVVPTLTPDLARETIERYTSAKRQYQLLSAISVVVVLIAVTAVLLWKYRLTPATKPSPNVVRERVVRLPSTPVPALQTSPRRTADTAPRPLSDAPKKRLGTNEKPTLVPPSPTKKNQRVSPVRHDPIELAPVRFKRPTLRPAQRPKAPRTVVTPGPVTPTPRTVETKVVTKPAPKRPVVVIPIGVEETQVTTLRRELKRNEPTIVERPSVLGSGSDELKVHKSRLVRKLQHCLRAARRMGIEGKLPLNFTITPSGHVAGLTLPTAIQSAGIQSCLRTTISSFVFPQQSRAITARLVIIP
ncbi:MAG: zinc-ribbon domain-containing protein [Myxococcales bacterium]|nr:zinc-ribbon domain-containing protein [Myxococcales bacterium]